VLISFRAPLTHQSPTVSSPNKQITRERERSTALTVGRTPWEHGGTHCGQQKMGLKGVPDITPNQHHRVSNSKNIVCLTISYHKTTPKLVGAN